LALRIFMPLVVRALLTKPFRSFRLSIVRESDTGNSRPATHQP
jgi:hypothetical protein